MDFALVPSVLADFDGHMDWDSDWGVVMVIGMVLFWALIIAGAVLLVRELSHSRRGPREAAADPLKTLDQRLAEGKISPEDYRERRAILSGDEPPPGA
jgi:putative membrane protein